MSKLPVAFTVAMLGVLLPAGVPRTSPPANNPGQPFEELEAKIDDLAEKIDDLGETADELGGKIDDLGDKVDDLSAQTELLESGIGLIEAKLDQVGETCPGVPNLRAAITKQIEQLDPPPGGGCAVLVELVTLTDDPFKPMATGVQTPAAVSVLSGPTTNCSLTVSGDWRCRYEMLLQYDVGSTGSGDYVLDLQYACDPDVEGCDLCSGTETIEFSLATTACVEVEVPGD